MLPGHQAKIQIAPASLPALKRDKTTFRHDTGDRYGQHTIRMLVNPNTVDPNDLVNYALLMPSDYDPERRMCRTRGEVIIRVKAPPRTKISWFTIGGAFRTYQGQQARETDNRITYAVGQPDNFQDVYRSQVPSWMNHWRYNWDGDVVLTEPADHVYVRYTANAGLNTTRACLHQLSGQTSAEALEVVYEYRVNGQLRTVERRLTAPRAYTIDCDDLCLITSPSNWRRLTGDGESAVLQTKEGHLLFPALAASILQLVLKPNGIEVAVARGLHRLG
jgi:hypothetical protein